MLREFLTFLDDWEKRVISKELSPDNFLTDSTSEGLRVTINSAIELSTLLLGKYNFEYMEKSESE